ncbi:MAG: hypothetical protein ACETVN_01675 [Asgard group archaeon]
MLPISQVYKVGLIQVFCTLRADVEKWIQKENAKGRFRNRNHAIE